ncbi:MoxR family ATPase [Burkholderiaceae bacterium DAT-1]|nr:MoxR family ATPase [Burkholderiaceae bacterium DAT-1]
MSETRSLIASLLNQLDQVILGKTDTIRLAVCCLLADGHLLLEDVPGVGKTTLAHALATSLGLRFQRIQFTSDMLPADLIGVSIYERERGEFRFHPGPVFSQIVLADEINRATPRTQSALLEAMEEGQVTLDGETYVLPEPFFVIATQNPMQQTGTFALPESQLDRFLMRLSLGYPDPVAERAMLMGESRRDMLARMQAAVSDEAMRELRQAVKAVHVSIALVDYVQALVQATRERADWVNGLSPRAALGLIQAARAHALVSGRTFAAPDDVQAVFVAVASHRLQSSSAGRQDVAQVARLLAEVAIP